MHFKVDCKRSLQQDLVRYLIAVGGDPQAKAEWDVVKSLPSRPRPVETPETPEIGTVPPTTGTAAPAA